LQNQTLGGKDETTGNFTRHHIRIKEGVVNGVLEAKEEIWEMFSRRYS